MDAKRFLPALAAGALMAGLPASGSGQAPGLPCGDTYTAASGETLAGVAERCRVDLAALIRLNPGLNRAGALRPGQELRIPGLRGVDAADAADRPGAARREAPPRLIEHVVEAGQTLAEISARYRVPVRDILEANDLGDPNVLTIGERLTIPVPPASRRGPAARPGQAPPAAAGPPTAAPPAASPAAPDRPDPAPAAPARPTAGEQVPLVRDTPEPPARADTAAAAEDTATAPSRVSPADEGRPIPADAAAEPSSGPQEPGKRVRAVTGTLTDEGAECRALRTDRGVLYLLDGPVPFPVGARVKVVGGFEETGACEGGPTLAVEDIEPESRGGDG